MEAEGRLIHGLREGMVVEPSNGREKEAGEGCLSMLD